MNIINMTRIDWRARSTFISLIVLIFLTAATALPSGTPFASDSAHASGCEVIPYINSGSSSTVAGVSVNVTRNNAQIYSTDWYYHNAQANSDSFLGTSWEFTPAVSEIQIEIAFNADTDPGIEQYTISGRAADGTTEVLRWVANTQDGDRVYQAAAPMKYLSADFIPLTGTYGSIVRFHIPSASGDCGVPYVAPKPTPVVTYTGTTGAISPGGSITLNSTVTTSAPATPCTGDGTITYTATPSPLDPTNSASTLTLANPVDTSSWQSGVYNITVSYGGDSACATGQSSGNDLLTVATTSSGSAFGGGYQNLSGGKASFGFVVQTFTKLNLTKGQLQWVQPGKWKFKGVLNNYNSGTASGTGNLFYWSKDGRGGGNWVPAINGAASVSIGISATTPPTKKSGGTVGQFGISFTGTPVGGITLPNFAKSNLNSGTIRIN